MDRWFGDKWSILRRRFDYVTLRFCGLLLGFVGDCMITGCYVSPPLKGKRLESSIQTDCIGGCKESQH